MKLFSLLKKAPKCNIGMSLEHVIVDGQEVAKSVKMGEPFNVKLLPEEGYKIVSASVIMNKIKIRDDFRNGIITITKATGDIAINARAAKI